MRCSVWHPLCGPVRESPLALCDYSTVDQTQDLEASDLVFPHYVGEQWLAKYNQRHKWHYLSDQMPNEVWLFKCYESLQDGRARCKWKSAPWFSFPAPNGQLVAVHTSFQLPPTAEEVRSRESIEFRCLVFDAKY